MSHRQAPVRSAVATQLRRRESGSIRATVTAILSAAALAGMAQQVMAQEASSTDSKKDEGLEEIHITGSRIVRKDIEANSPTLTISSETLENRTEFSVESALNELPQFI